MDRVAMTFFVCALCRWASYRGTGKIAFVGNRKHIGMDVDRNTQKWVRTWQAAGPLLAEIERRELREMTHEQWQQAVEDVLSVIPSDTEVPTTSGLVEQQKWFAKLRPRSVC
jgi:hypothetical protein